ncbi:MAG: replication initiation protein [Saprospiraceae bacterium]|nr:replication initiation protein [Saprospiraceae bacterium]MCF8248631.1 replication initiation protein [Saprospiraceae bacterium]MCF8278879.1 replication initiation protein [Bacteroidales bacterium]MCF8310679.1 replication initiation protein [Saprospiraceae bacterium]MCF8439238.1 replication initiation protein [Saprospiraceae bacterium]
MEKTKKVAAIANQFIQHARYKLTPREQKLILYMATLLRPEDSDFETYLVPVSEIEYILKSDETKKHGSFYERLDDLLDSITDKKITFPTDFTVDGHRLRGHINWVAGAVPKYDEHGVLCVEFGFSPQMKPFLLGLKERFTRFEFLEVAKMKSGFSIRIYQMCKAYYFENIRHGRNVFAASIKEFKSRLGIADKYPDFRNFRRKVLDVAREEINEKTHLRIEYDFIKKGRNITDLRIVINEKTDFTPEPGTPDEVPVEVTKKKAGRPTNDLQSRIESLTEAQRRAFNTLTEYGVSMVFALDEVLPIIKGSELVGYEDYFVLFMLAFFEKKTIVKGAKEKVKAFAGWVTNRRFEEANLYAQLLEQVISRKKSLKDDERANRERAKDITAAEFRELLEAEKSIGKTMEPAFSIQKKTANQASRMSRVGEGADLFSQNKKTEPAQPVALTKDKAVFSFDTFKKEHANIYKRIHKERKAAFENFTTASNYKLLLENSVQAYCEQWYNQQQ